MIKMKIKFDNMIIKIIKPIKYHNERFFASNDYKDKINKCINKRFTNEIISLIWGKTLFYSDVRNDCNLATIFIGFTRIKLTSKFIDENKLVINFIETKSILNPFVKDNTIAMIEYYIEDISSNSELFSAMIIANEAFIKNHYNGDRKKFEVFIKKSNPMKRKILEKLYYITV